MSKKPKLGRLWEEVVRGAVDLISGQQITLKQGPLIRAVMASCAVPGFMPNITLDDMILVDGAVVGAVPASPAKNIGAEAVIGVDVGPCLCRPCIIEDGIDAINRAASIMEFHLSKRSRESADVVIKPEVSEIAWTDFLNYEELIHLGEVATEAKIDDVKKMLVYPFRRKVFLWSNRIFRRLKR